MKRYKAHFVSFIGSVSVGSVCAYFGANIPFHDQWPLYEALRSTSSIIFAVIGAWLTILYPEALKKIFTRNAQFSGARVDSIELLVSNIRYSTAILATIMIVGIVGQVLRHLSVSTEYVGYLRALCFSLLGVLTFLQFWTLLMTLAQAEMAREDLNVSADKQAKVSRFNSIVQSSNPNGANGDKGKQQ